MLVSILVLRVTRFGHLRNAKYLMRITEIIKPPTADQARIKALSAAKKRAADALKAERERQKRAKGLEMLRSTYP